MARYSRVYKIGTSKFRYDYEDSYLQCVTDVDEQVLKDNEEWQEKYHHDLWEIADGYVLVDEIGLSRDSWKADPKGWCQRYADELRIEAASYFKMERSMR